jgi:hypothetical protein
VRGVFNEIAAGVNKVPAFIGYLPVFFGAGCFSFLEGFM